MKEFNLLSDYSKKKVKRFVGKGIRTIDHRIIASEREKLFFDGYRLGEVTADITKDGTALQKN